MKSIKTLIFICLLAASNFGQEARWTRIESENKEFSASFPPNFLVDADTKDNGRQLFLIAFQNGVEIELRIYKDAAALARLTRKSLPGDGSAEGKSFTIENFSGKNIIFNKNRYVNTLHLASKSQYYFLSVTARDAQKPEVNRFLYSVKLNGVPVFTGKNGVEPTDSIIPITDLKTSPEVAEALNRKPEKTKNKIAYELDSADLRNEYGDDVRPPIVLLHHYPKFNPRFDNAQRSVSRRVKIRAQLLANGQVGDMTVYSNAERDLINDCIEAIRKTKFVPAYKDGKPIDADRIFDFSFEALRVNHRF
jgi:hypothetical protein